MDANAMDYHNEEQRHEQRVTPYQCSGEDCDARSDLYYFDGKILCSECLKDELLDLPDNELFAQFGAGRIA